VAALLTPDSPSLLRMDPAVGKGGVEEQKTADGRRGRDFFNFFGKRLVGGKRLFTPGEGSAGRMGNRSRAAGARPGAEWGQLPGSILHRTLDQCVFYNYECKTTWRSLSGRMPGTIAV